MKLRLYISYFICFLIAIAAFPGGQANVLRDVTQVVAQWQNTEETRTTVENAERFETDYTGPSESIRLQPQPGVPTAARAKDVSKTFLLSRYLSYLDDSFSLHTVATFTDAVAFYITAYRFLLVFPKHWFW